MLHNVSLPRAFVIEGLDDEIEDIWQGTWLPVLHAMERICHDARGEIRTRSLLALQRCLLSPGYQDLYPHHWHHIFKVCK